MNATHTAQPNNATSIISACHNTILSSLHNIRTPLSCALLLGISTSCHPDDGLAQFTENTSQISPHKTNIFPSDLADNPRDFVDDRGHKWTWTGAAKFTDEPYAMPTRVQHLATEPSREELAYGMRGVMLLGDQEYRVLDPVYDIADQIIALRHQPDLLPVGGEAPPQSSPPRVSTDLKPQTIFYDPHDDRGPSTTPQEGCGTEPPIL